MLTEELIGIVTLLVSVNYSQLSKFGTLALDFYTLTSKQTDSKPPKKALFRSIPKNVHFCPFESKFFFVGKRIWTHLIELVEHNFWEWKEIRLNRQSLIGSNGWLLLIFSFYYLQNIKKVGIFIELNSNIARGGRWIFFWIGSFLRSLAYIFTVNFVVWVELGMKIEFGQVLKCDMSFYCIMP